MPPAVTTATVVRMDDIEPQLASVALAIGGDLDEQDAPRRPRALVTQQSSTGEMLECSICFGTPVAKNQLQRVFSFSSQRILRINSAARSQLGSLRDFHSRDGSRSSTATTQAPAPAVLESFVALGCSHVFHKDCIAKWAARHPTCPNCRTKIDETKVMDAADGETHVNLASVPIMPPAVANPADNMQGELQMAMRRRQESGAVGELVSGTTTSSENCIMAEMAGPAVAEGIWCVWAGMVLWGNDFVGFGDPQYICTPEYTTSMLDFFGDNWGTDNRAAMLHLATRWDFLMGVVCKASLMVAALAGNTSENSRHSARYRCFAELCTNLFILVGSFACIGFFGTWIWLSYELGMVSEYEPRCSPPNWQPLNASVTSNSTPGYHGTNAMEGNMTNTTLAQQAGPPMLVGDTHVWDLAAASCVCQAALWIFVWHVVMER
jgi:hypothetical protein